MNASKFELKNSKFVEKFRFPFFVEIHTGNSRILSLPMNLQSSISRKLQKTGDPRDQLETESKRKQNVTLSGLEGIEISNGPRRSFLWLCAKFQWREETLIDLGNSNRVVFGVSLFGDLFIVVKSRRSKVHVINWHKENETYAYSVRFILRLCCVQPFPSQAQDAMNSLKLLSVCIHPQSDY